MVGGVVGDVRLLSGHSATLNELSEGCADVVHPEVDGGPAAEVDLGDGRKVEANALRIHERDPREPHLNG